jgi:hypothetical protein
MNLLIQRSLIFIALMVVGLVVYASWFGNKADNYDETAVPYLQLALPEMTSWRYQRLRPLLSPSAQQDFDNDNVRAAYLEFDRLGEMISMDKPQYLASGSAISKELGEVEIVEYQIRVQFDSGPATIKVKLIADSQSYYIHHFGIQSEVFVDG